MADDVQTGAGEGDVQGDEATSGLYDLDSVPQELREHVEPHLKAITRNVDSKFREASEYRKQWEPYEQLGVNNMDPQALAGLLAFAETANDDEAFAKWFEETGRDSGLFEQLGYMKADEPFTDPGEFNPEQIAEMVKDAVAEQMAPVNEQLSQQQQEQIQREAEQQVVDTWAQIEADNPDLPDDAKDAVLRFALSYIEGDEDDIGQAIGDGFEEYKRIVAQGESDLFAQKSNQPGPVEGPGSADTSAPRITSFEDAKAAAKERLEKSIAT